MYMYAQMYTHTHIYIYYIIAIVITHCPVKKTPFSTTSLYNPKAMTTAVVIHGLLLCFDPFLLLESTGSVQSKISLPFAIAMIITTIITIEQLTLYVKK